MKINKWTLGLAAVGLVSLASVAKAEEAATPILTALSSTTISGYVDTSAQWNPGTGRVAPGFAFAGGKRDGFNLNSVLVSLEKPLAEGEWSAGYRVDLMFGPDATQIGRDASAGSENLRQAFVALRAPVGNGLDLKIGRWDSIIGYESSDSYKNPNYTRSYAYTLTPTEHTGVLATYQALEFLSVNVGVANTDATGPINGRSARAESHKSYMASAAFTAPDSLGFLAGSALYAGIVYGDSSFAATRNEIHYFAAGSLATPVEGLRLGVSFDYIDNPLLGGRDGYAVGAYASFKATEKLGLNLRGEYATHGGLAGAAALQNLTGSGIVANPAKVFAVTATLQYDLWENVLTRLEGRWDHAADGSGVYGRGNRKNDFLVAANVVYKF